MSDDLIASIDCSTTGAKCVVWDRTGGFVAAGKAPLDLHVPAPNYGEQDPEQWWSATCTAVREAIAQLPPGSRIAALAIAHQRESFACLDADGAAVRPAMLWLDGRAGEQVERFGDERAHRVTGKPPNPTPAYYKLMWLREHEPETIAATRALVDVSALLVLRITGEFRTSRASMDPLGIVDLSTGDYDDALVASIGLSRDRLPALTDPGEHIGSITEEAAALLGIAAGTPVIAGAGDGQGAGLGAGLTEPGRAYLNLGTGLISGAVSRDYRPSSAYRALFGAVPGTFNAEVFIGAGTYMINWFMDTLVVDEGRVPGEGSVQDRLERLAAEVPLGTDGLTVVPYWNGALTPYWDHHARGLVFGLTGAHGLGHWYRAVLEGIAFELRVCIEAAERDLSEPIESFIIMGGGTRNALWCQMFADVLRRPLVMAGHEEATCLGAGILAAYGAGFYSSIEEAATGMTRTGVVYSPDEATSRAYDPHFEVYRSLYPALRAAFAQAAEVRG